jgi:hypothetical protein
MPNLHLAPVDVKTLLDYFESKAGAAAQSTDSSDKTESESTKTSQGLARN